MKKYFIVLFLLSVACSSKTFSQDPNWVRDNTWYFKNFRQAELGWDVFRETYIGVAPEPSGDFDLLFYNEIFKTKLASGGHCHGMCVMATIMQKNGGHLGYCHPPYVYAGTSANDGNGPIDPTLKRAIQIMHGTQISHSFLSRLLDIIAINKNRDGRYAYQQVEYYAAKNDPCVLSITKSMFPSDGAGHVVIPYHTENLGSKKRIYVYDPNLSYYDPISRSKYDKREVYIEIDNATGEWNAINTSDATEDYKGNPSGGLNTGNCLAIPISIAGKKDRLPQSLLAEGAYAINTMFIFSEEKAEIKQIKETATGKKYLNETGTDIEQDDKLRLDNILPYIPSNVEDSSQNHNQIYFIRGQPSALEVQIQTKGKYRIGLLFGGKYTETEGKGNGNIQSFKTPDLKVNQ